MFKRLTHLFDDENFCCWLFGHNFEDMHYLRLFICSRCGKLWP